MVKCNNCGNEDVSRNTPAVCSECGHIMKPVISVFKRPKKRKVKIEEKTFDVLED